MANTDILSNLEHFGQNISVRGADLWYGDFHAIRDISVDIPARQVTAFIGPSGCGKSTFLKCFNRMNDLVDGCRVSGDFRIGDVDIYGKIDINDLRAERQKIRVLQRQQVICPRTPLVGREAALIQGKRRVKQRMLRADPSQFHF